MSGKQRSTFEECFQFLYYFSVGCTQNVKVITQYIEVIERVRGSVEVGQTRLLNMLYQTDDHLIKQINAGIMETAVCKIVKNIKTVDYGHC